MKPPRHSLRRTVLAGSLIAVPAMFGVLRAGATSPPRAAALEQAPVKRPVAGGGPRRRPGASAVVARVFATLKAAAPLAVAGLLAAGAVVGVGVGAGSALASSSLPTALAFDATSRLVANYQRDEVQPVLRPLDEGIIDAARSDRLRASGEPLSPLALRALDGPSPALAPSSSDGNAGVDFIESDRPPSSPIVTPTAPMSTPTPSIPVQQAPATSNGPDEFDPPAPTPEPTPVPTPAPTPPAPTPPPGGGNGGGGGPPAEPPGGNGGGPPP